MTTLGAHGPWHTPRIYGHPMCSPIPLNLPQLNVRTITICSASVPAMKSGSQAKPMASGGRWVFYVGRSRVRPEPQTCFEFHACLLSGEGSYCNAAVTLRQMNAEAHRVPCIRDSHLIKDPSICISISASVSISTFIPTFWRPANPLVDG